jgi:hypothetical protein
MTTNERTNSPNPAYAHEEKKIAWVGIVMLRGGPSVSRRLQ